MITITFDFPSPELETLAVQELSEHYGYPANVLATVPTMVEGEDKEMREEMIEQRVPNKESRVDFCKRMLGAHLRDIVVARITNAKQAEALSKARADISATVVS